MPSTVKKRFFSVIPILLQSLIFLFALSVFKLFCSLKYEGVEELVAFQKAQKARGETSALIFAPNHSSEWDGPLVRVGLPFWWRWSPMYFVSQKKDFYDSSGWRKHIYGGRIFNLVGAYPVYSGHHDYAYALQNFTALLQKGRCVCIFPEGRRTTSGALGTAHGGVAFLAHATQTPVVPVAIKGLTLLTARDFFLRRRKVTIHFGTPMRVKEIIGAGQLAPQPSVDDFHNGAGKVMVRVKELLG